MVQAQFSRLRWEKGTSYLQQGVKGYYVPYNAVGGSNGSFVCVTPSRLHLELKTSSGDYFDKEIMRTVKDVNGWKKLTDKRLMKLEKRLRNTTFEIVDDEIIDLYQIVDVS